MKNSFMSLSDTGKWDNSPTSPGWLKPLSCLKSHSKWLVITGIQGCICHMKYLCYLRIHRAILRSSGVKFNSFTANLCHGSRPKSLQGVQFKCKMLTCSDAFKISLARVWSRPKEVATTQRKREMKLMYC